MTGKSSQTMASWQIKIWNFLCTNSPPAIDMADFASSKLMRQTKSLNIAN